MVEKAVHRALEMLGAVESARAFRWLGEYLHNGRDPNYTPKLKGVKGGHEAYKAGQLDAILTLINDLGPDDRYTLEVVAGLLSQLMEPVTDQARGVVQLKTQIRRYPVIDWAETAKSGGLLVYVLDENGEIVKEDFTYTYAYVRIYAGRGDKSRKKAKLRSVYADEGMGKGGTGGYVAAALTEGLVTEEEILDAWHAGQEQGKEHYEKFIKECATLLNHSELGMQLELPNSEAREM